MILSPEQVALLHTNRRVDEHDTANSRSRNDFAKAHKILHFLSQNVDLLTVFV
jgi:hypothetical protein